MARGSISRYTDWRWLLQYVLDNPGKALKIAAVALVVALVTILSLAVEAIPIWIAGYVIGFVILMLSYREVQRVLMVRAASEDDAGALTPGPTKVHGTVVQATEELLKTPGGTECVAYEYQRVRNRRGDESSQRHTDRGSIPFYVEDGTGRALVSPQGSRLELKHDEGSRLTMLTSSNAREESYLEVGDTVAVYGEGVRPDVDFDPEASSQPDTTTGTQADASAASTEAAASGRTDGPTGTDEGQSGQSAGDGGAVSPFPEGMEIPAEHLPEGVDSQEELIEQEDLEPPEDMPPQYREFYQGTMADGQFMPGMGAQAGSNDDDSGMLRGMAEMAADLPGRYDHLYGREEMIVGQGPEYGTVLITDKGGFRVFGKQLLVTLALIGAGIAVIGGSAAAMVGLVPL